MKNARLPLSRAKLAYLHDIAMSGVSFILALYLRLGENPFTLPGSVQIAFLTFVCVCAVCFRLSGLYRGVWRYASVPDMIALTRVVTLSVLVFVLVMFLMTRMEVLPRSLPLINWFTLLFCLGGPRFAYRLLKDRRLDIRAGGKAQRPRIPVLLVGSDDDAELFIRALRTNPHSEYRVVGLIGLKDGRVGRQIHGLPVLGVIADIPQVLARLERQNRRPRKLVLTEKDSDAAVIEQLLDLAGAHGLTLARTPRMTELRDGAADETQVRPIVIEDLLNRPQAVLDPAAMRAFISGRRVLITGAGGSIGSELVRQIANYDPAHLALVDSGEFNLYAIDYEMGCTHPNLPRAAILGDVRDARQVGDVFTRLRPEVVFHAAALKHVPMVEANPLDGLLTNSVGTRIVADACVAAGVRVMVQISTDKAVNPTNVMGSSKRIAEAYCQALDLDPRSGDTRFVTVRFGNVLGSTGSVVPLFQKQLAAGGPLTVTHPEMTRYFMTIREAVQLVIQASVLGVTHGSDYQGRIFVLDMGKPVRIVELARQMIRLAGLRPDTDVRIEFTGLRPGEKLFEEIFHGSEPPVPTGQQGVLVASPRVIDLEWLGRQVEDLEAACRERREPAGLAVMEALVPEYRKALAESA